MMNARTVAKLMLAEVYQKMEDAVTLKVTQVTAGNPDNVAVTIDEDAIVEAAVSATERLYQW